jgi:hypothetical protein
VGKSQPEHFYTTIHKALHIEQNAVTTHKQYINIKKKIIVSIQNFTAERERLGESLGRVSLIINLNNNFLESPNLLLVPRFGTVVSFAPVTIL